MLFDLGFDFEVVRFCGGGGGSVGRWWWWFKGGGSIGFSVKVPPKGESTGSNCKIVKLCSL